MRQQILQQAPRVRHALRWRQRFKEEIVRRCVGAVVQLEDVELFLRRPVGRQRVRELLVAIDTQELSARQLVAGGDVRQRRLLACELRRRRPVAGEDEQLRSVLGRERLLCDGRNATDRRAVELSADRRPHPAVRGPRLAEVDALRVPVDELLNLRCDLRVEARRGEAACGECGNDVGFRGVAGILGHHKAAGDAGEGPPGWHADAETFVLVGDDGQRARLLGASWIRSAAITTRLRSTCGVAVPRRLDDRRSTTRGQECGQARDAREHDAASAGELLPHPEAPWQAHCLTQPCILPLSRGDGVAAFDW